LNSLAVLSAKGYKYWSQNQTVGRWMFQKSSIDIEMTSYALLTSLRENNITKCIEIVRWIVNQTNYLGGYSSTQNTILALQALTTFSLKTSTDISLNAQLQVTTEISDSSGNLKIFNITDDNFLVLQSWSIKKCPKVVHITASGFGNLFLQLIVSYNIPKLDEPPVFLLNQSVEHQYSINRLTLKTCVSYIGLNQETGMSIVESGVFSGFTVNKDELEKIVSRNEVKDLKLVEYLDNNKVAFYFDKIDNDVRCILWNIERVNSISTLKPVIIRVYDYYKPELQVTSLFYGLSDVTACDVSNELENC
jgi:CD109 antigen